MHIENIGVNMIKVSLDFLLQTITLLTNGAAHSGQSIRANIAPINTQLHINNYKQA